MSANYTLAIVNPQVTGDPRAVVYTTAPNVVDLTLCNNSGIDRQIGAAPGTFLLVLISANILTATQAEAIQAAGPWQVASVTPPSGDGQPFTLSLQPPAGGVSFPNGGSVVVTLNALTPSATGPGLLRVKYEFDRIAGDNISLSGPVISQKPVDPNLPALVGDAAPLQFTLSINNGGPANPLMVSSPPVTDANAVANELHFRLEYGAQARANQLGQGGLVPSWNQAQPPAFRVFCPYNLSCDPPAPEDLTDCVPLGSSCYNGFTSAYQIQGTLDPTNPEITNDGFWQIAPDPGAPYPVWQLTPTPENTHLFTPVETLATESGPFLHWYLVRIITALIDPATPETPLYLHWTGFPGFNDGILAFPLQKALLAIQSFSCTVQRKLPGPELVMEWSTIGAQYCTISGETRKQQPQAHVQQGTQYLRSATATQPMQSTYTLTATSGDPGVSVTRTLSVRWVAAATPAPVALGSATAVRVTPDGAKLLVLAASASTASVGFYSPTTLKPLPQASLTPAEGAAENFAIAPDGSLVFVVSTSGAVYGYPLGSAAAPKNSGAVVAGTNAPYLIGVSPSGSEVAVTASDGFLGGGANALVVLSASDLATAVHPRVPLDDQPAALMVGPKTGRYFVALGKSLIVLDPATLGAVPGSPLAYVLPALLGVSPDEQAVYCVYADGQAQSFMLAKLAADTLTPQIQMAVGIGYYGLTVALLDVPLAALAVSADSTVLFFIGVQTGPLLQNQLVSQLSAYDTASLAELPWSPVTFGDFMPLDLAMAPDGSRLFALAGVGIGTPQESAYLYAVDPDFV